jgi:hypothetical protein
MASPVDITISRGMVWATMHRLPDARRAAQLSVRVQDAARQASSRCILIDARRIATPKRGTPLPWPEELIARLTLPPGTRTALLYSRYALDGAALSARRSALKSTVALFTTERSAVRWLQAVCRQSPARTEAPGSLRAAKRLLQNFARDRATADKDRVTAELSELYQYLLDFAARSGIDVQGAMERALARASQPRPTRAKNRRPGSVRH